MIHFNIKIIENWISNISDNFNQSINVSIADKIQIMIQKIILNLYTIKITEY